MTVLELHMYQIIFEYNTLIPEVMIGHLRKILNVGLNMVFLCKTQFFGNI